jgi:hypothetical protein
MGSILSQHKIFVVLGGIALAIGVWYSLAPSAGPTILSADGSGAGPGQEVVDTLRQLDAVKLDGAIFSQKTFAALKDFSTQIVPEPVGRPNPFAPLSSSARASASTTRDAQIFSPGTAGR